MSKGSSRQHGGLCLMGHQRRIPGCPRNPPDSVGDVQGILLTAWGPVSEGTPREDPGMSKDPPDSMGTCV